MQAKLGIETDPRSASEAALRNGPESSAAMQPPEGKYLRVPAEQGGALDGERVLRIDRAVGRTRRSRHIGAGAHPARSRRSACPPFAMS